MLKKLLAIAIGLLITSNCFASEIDSAAFKKALKNYADCISQTAYSTKELANKADSSSYEIALTRAEEAETSLNKIIASFNTEEELSEAYNLTVAFSKKSDLNAYTSELVCKMLQKKANFLIADGKQPNVELTKNIQKRTAQASVAPDNLLKKRHKRLIMIETPVAEAIVCVEDTDKNRRVNNLEKIFKRHGCKIISSYTNENKKADKYCYYFTGKKYVIDALLGHFDGSVVNSDLKAVVKMTTGGFWGGKKKAEFTVGPKRSSKNIMGELSWYKSVIEHEPITYVSDNNYDELLSIGSIETVAGVKKLLFKNVKAEIFVFANDKTENESIYHNKLELGDIYIDAK